MVKPTGFMEYKRKEAKYRPAGERVRDYKEVMDYLSYEDIKIQASRCMDCGVPFCHTIGCHIHNLIPEWNDLVSRGKWEEALRRLETLNPLPEITGRVCPAPCEASCTLSINDSPVAIRQIELAIIENGFERGWIKPLKPKKEIKKKIAIIGSGPAGLTAAWALRKMGYTVTVYEKSKKIGGILRLGIPDFKLEKWVLDRRINLMKRSGIKFKPGVKIGEDISASYLKRTNDVILLATGAGQARDLKIPGRDLDGIYFAMDYLTKSNAFVSGFIKEKDIISAKGKNVLVIGGGDTGSDCVGTANRQGARKVYQFEILPKPPEWEKSWNPKWPEWPIILRTSSSQKEGVSLEWAVSTTKFTGQNGQVKEVSFRRVKWERGEKGFQIKEIPNSEVSLKVDLVLLAMGFLHTEHNKLLKSLEIALEKNGNIKIKDNYSTSVRGIFAVGDATTGASLVVTAIGHGNQAAKSIHQYLSKPK